MTARCPEHNHSLPCAGCRADELAAPKENDRPLDVWERAAGEREPRLTREPEGGDAA